MSLLHTVLSSPGGGSGQLPYAILTPAPSTTGVAWPSANAAIGIRFRVSRPTPVTAVDIWVGTASGNVDAGIYTSADGGATMTLLKAAGSTAAAGSSVRQSVALGATVVLLPGVDYWAFVAADNTILALARQALPAALGGYKNAVVSKATSFPLPATLDTLVTVVSGYQPWVAVG